MTSAATDTSPAPRSATELFLAFSGLALQGFGGVMAVAQRELVERRRWLTRDAFVEEWAVAQVLPGPNVVNLALMLGHRHLGLRGALAAVSGMLLLPLVVVLVLAMLYAQASGLPSVAGALRGMGAVSAGLIAATALKLLPSLVRNPMGRPAAAAWIAGVMLALLAWRWPLALALAVFGPSAWWLAWHRLGPGRHQGPAR